jgi:hypothetical protein
MPRTLLRKKWIFGLSALIVALAMVFGSQALGLGMTQAKAAPAPLPGTQPGSYVLTVSGGDTFVFTGMHITSQVQPMQYVSVGSNGVTHLKQFGKSMPPVITLIRPFSGDRSDGRLWAWHEQAFIDNRQARVSARINDYDANGKLIFTWSLQNAYAARIDFAGNTGNSAAQQTLTLALTADQVIATAGTTS